MEYQDQVTDENLKQYRLKLLRCYEWSKSIQWICFALALGPIGVILWMVNDGTVDTESTGFWSITTVSVITTCGLILFGSFVSLVKILFIQALNNTGFELDVVRGAKMAFQSMFAPYLPGFKERDSLLSVGKEIIRATNVLQEREVYIALALLERTNNEEIRAALQEVTKAALAAYNMEAQQDTLDEMKRELDEPLNVLLMQKASGK